MSVAPRKSAWFPLLLTWCVAFAVPVSGAEGESTESLPLRVLSYNIHHGRGTDNLINLERIARVIKDANADLVALQEVDVRTRRSGGVDQLAELARIIGMHGRFGKGRDYEGGDYGQAVLSRWPIRSVEVHVLPGSSAGEERIAVAAEIAGEGERPEILFVGTHLHHVQEAHRVAQANRLLDVLEKRRIADVVLLGDFNAEPGSESMNLFLKSWKGTTADDALTYPSEKPIKKIDWVLYPATAQWRVTRSEVVEERLASDHRPVLVEFAIPVKPTRGTPAKR